MSVRLDKWLQVARVFKTRSRATRACALGRVRVNGVVAKAHRPLNVGDEIVVKVGTWPRIVQVRVLRDKPVRKAEAADLYEDLTPPRPEPVKPETGHGAVYREPGAGRPTKRERRDLDRWRRR